MGEGIRETRLCVEGVGLNSTLQPPRSASSIYLAWDPPLLQDMLPATYVESTDLDTDVTLQVAVASGRGESAPVWGACNASIDIDGTGRAWYRAAVPSNVSFALLRHCSATPLVDDSLGRCFTGAALLSHVPAGGFQASRCTRGLSSSGSAQSVGAAIVTTSILVPLPLPMPNAVLNVSVRVSVWDGGVLLSAAPAFSSLVFSRSLPVIKSCVPNPILLGPVGGLPSAEGVAQEPAVITLYGVGFRTPEEVLDPRNGLTGLPAAVHVFVAGEPCLNASVVRTDTRFASVSCIFPSASVGGGVVPVTMRMMGQTVQLEYRDGTNAGFSSECANGYYGQFGVSGHQLCRPCPTGGLCTGGVGRAPIAAPGFYNTGLPPRSVLNVSDATTRYASVDAVVPVSSCPSGASDGGRGLACLLACEPPEACLGANMCADGYASVHPVYRCAHCAGGYYRSTGVCVKCPILGFAAILLVLCGLLVVSGIGYVFSAMDIRLCTASTVLEYAQIVSLFQLPVVPWPPAVRSVLRSLSTLRLNIEVGAPECYTSISLTPEAKLWVVVILPLLVLALAAAAFVILGVVKGSCVFQRAGHSSGAIVDAVTVVRPASSGFWKNARLKLFQDDAWSHGPTCCRTALSLLGSLYLPVVQASLEVWNCTSTSPSDGREYLSIVFEECGKPGGLQERMVPWAAAGLLAYGALYPILLALFFYRYHDLIVEDQLLRAAGTGDDKRSNPRAYLLRQYAAPVYEEYRPGYQYAALLVLARKALVCICALLLNKSAVLLCASITFVIAVVLLIQAATRPLMTPGAGYVAALAQFGGQLTIRGGPKGIKLHHHLTEIAEFTRHPPLLDVAAGKYVWSELDAPSRPWWSAAIDWNLLESVLQMQILLTGLLAVMYNAALESVYASRAVPAVTAVFFLLLTLATAHVAATVGYDLFLQVQRAVLSLLRRDDQGDDAAKVTSLLDSIPTWRMFLVVLCPCTMGRARARHILTGDSGGRQRGTLASAALASTAYSQVGVSDWLVNPLELRPLPAPTTGTTTSTAVDTQ